MVAGNMKMALNRAMEAKRASDAAYFRLELHRETCPTCKQPGMSIDVIRKGKCAEGVRIADEVYITGKRISG